ncbi:MAG: HU family DNA-binding protein [Gammaproteobacteria bacterium]|nr:HU family DNA-binding protein [Gammaproteobacteria bacterium]
MAAKPKKAKKAAPVAKTIKEKFTKTQMLNQIAEETALSRKQVSSVFDSLESIINGHIKKTGCGEFTLPGLLKIKTRKIPARKAKKNVPNPFRPGEFMDVAAKPATTRVKILPLKKVKDMALQ